MSRLYAIALCLAVALPGVAVGQTPSDPTSFYCKSDNKCYYRSVDGVEQEIVASDTFHAEMEFEDNTDAFVIDGSTDAHGFHDSETIVGHAQGWTFEAGGGPFATSAVADSGGDLLFTTAAHGLAVGDIVSASDCTDTTYDAVYDVLTVPLTTTFTVAGTFAATDAACVVNHAAALVAGTGAANEYMIVWAASGSGATNNDVFEFSVRVNAAHVVGSKVQRKFDLSTDLGSMSGTFIATIAVADRVGFFVENVAGTGNITLKHFSIVLHHL